MKNFFQLKEYIDASGCIHHFITFEIHTTQDLILQRMKTIFDDTHFINVYRENYYNKIENNGTNYNIKNYPQNSKIL